jgi:glutaredoxin-like protein NrdH
MAKIPVTIWTTPNCVQCQMTKKEMDKHGIIYEVKDLTTEPKKLAEFQALGFTSAPIVTTDIKIWSGFRLSKIKGLADFIHSQEREN